jgi:glutamyl-Q tRNA(Asp) synthetase
LAELQTKPGGFFMNPQVTRFAPSPTGQLHLGHAFSALVAWDLAVQSGGRFILRMEDIDTARCRPEFMEGIYEDLSWLGLSWETPVRIQSQHTADTQAALQELDDRGLLYPCFCTRKDILREIESAPAAPHGPEGSVYPGLCKARPMEERRRLVEARVPHSLRLDLARAVALTGSLDWEELKRGKVSADPFLLGDIVLARKDVASSYHLACTVDDALQGVTLVSRGEDLFPATAIHRVLQSLLKLPVPLYYHHPLLRDVTGKRLSKRDRSQTLQALREAGVSPEEIQERCRAARATGEWRVQDNWW